MWVILGEPPSPLAKFGWCPFPLSTSSILHTPQSSHILTCNFNQVCCKNLTLIEVLFLNIRFILLTCEYRPERVYCFKNFLFFLFSLVIVTESLYPHSMINPVNFNGNINPLILIFKSLHVNINVSAYSCHWTQIHFYESCINLTVFEGVFMRAENMMKVTLVM